jgi:glucokinase
MAEQSPAITSYATERQYLMTYTDLALGIDIGGTNTALGYFDRSGRCLGATAIPTRSDQAPEACILRLHTAARALWAELPDAPRLVGIGVGAPNGNYFRGTIENPPNLSWGQVDLCGALSGYWDGLPIAVTNDANAAAFGELLFGAGQGLRDFMVITLGTGLGTGIVVNGELVHGHSGFAGELGHCIVEPGGRACGCGLRGCLETYASATGLARTTRELLAARPAAPGGLDPATLSAQQICAAALAGDAVAREAFQITGTILGRKLADAVALTSPEAIFLFGGLAKAGELILAPTREALDASLFHVFRGTVRVLPSGVPEGHAATLGAAALIWKELAPACVNRSDT